jgi:hypothetical protein
MEKNKNDKSKMAMLSEFDPTGAIICLTLAGLAVLAFMIIPLFSVFHAGKWYPSVETIIFIIIIFFLWLALTLVYVIKAERNVMTFLGNWDKKQNIPILVNILKDHLKQDYISVLLIGWIYWAVIGFWSLSYIIVHPQYKGLVYTPSETSNLYNSFLRLCGGQVFFSTIVLYFIIKCLTQIVNINWMLVNNPAAISNSAKKVINVFFWLSFILLLAGLTYCFAMYVDNLGSPSHFQMTLWLSFMFIITGLFIILACLYIFVIRNTNSLYHSVYCGYLTFWFGFALVNWFFYMDGLADNYSFGDDVPTWKNMPLSSYYYTFRVLTNINSGYLVLVLSSFIPLCFIQANTVHPAKVDVFRSNISLLIWAVLTITLCLLILGFSIGGMTNWYYLFVHYVSFAAGISAVLGVLTIAGLIIAGYAVYTIHKQNKEVYGEGHARYIQMIISTLLVLILLVIEYWVIWSNYSALGHKNTYPAKDINDRASTGWNDLQLSAFCITLSLLAISIKIFSGIIVHSDPVKKISGTV